MPDGIVPAVVNSKRYHVTTFGCQMNVHDSERIKGLLESVGLGEAAAPDDADFLVFNTCTIREKADDRLVAHLMDARAAKQRDPDKVIVVGGCWSESMKDELFEQFPFVDLAFGPGNIHRLGDFIQAGGEIPRGHFSTFDSFAGELPLEARPRPPGLAADLDRLQLQLRLLHRPERARPRAQPPPRRPGARGRRPGRRRRARADPARPERQLLRPRPAPGGRDQLRGAPARARRRRPASTGSGSRARIPRTCATT